MPTPSPTVLIIDDDPDVLASLRTMLAPAFTVVAAGSAREALDRLAFRRPDVILTDIYMPNGDGFQLLAELRRMGSDVPVIAISGGSPVLGPDPLALAAELGAVATIAKPFRGRELVATVRGAIAAATRPEPDDGGDHG
jgi:CheY-like chemotaxis protein